MLKIITALIAIVFSAGAIASQNCSVYLPDECKEILDSNVSFYEHIYSKDPFGKQIFLTVEVGCRVEHAGELDNDLMVKVKEEAFYNYKKYKLNTEVIKRIRDYSISFVRGERMVVSGLGEPPYLICYQ